MTYGIVATSSYFALYMYCGTGAASSHKSNSGTVSACMGCRCNMSSTLDVDA